MGQGTQPEANTLQGVGTGLCERVLNAGRSFPVPCVGDSLR